MQRIAGARVHVAGTTYRIDRSLVVCSGVGSPVTRGGVRRWRRFTCTQSVLRSGTLEDITFTVRPLDRRRFAILAPRRGP
jgi:hypothetical protein